MEVHIDPVAPNIEVFIFGAGHVAKALAPILTDMETNLTVIDDRVEYNNPQRFPNATRIMKDGLAFAEQHMGGPNTYYLVVTHDHQRDQDLVERLLDKNMAWLGLIGSRTKVTKFLVRYRAAGLQEALFKNLSAPVGLDIGAETPTEIAVSIAAEIIRIRRGQQAAPIPLSEIPIPARGGDGTATAPGLVSSDVSDDPKRIKGQ